MRSEQRRERSENPASVVAKSRREIAECDGFPSAGLSVSGLQDIAVAVKVVDGESGGERDSAPEEERERPERERQRERERDHKENVGGPHEDGDPEAAPAAAPRAPRRAFTAQRTAASAQKVAVASLIGWIAWPIMTGHPRTQRWPPQPTHERARARAREDRRAGRSRAPRTERQGTVPAASREARPRRPCAPESPTDSRGPSCRDGAPRRIRGG